MSFERILAFLVAKPLIGGLEISDTALRFAVATPGGQRTASVRLAPGILARGEIKDEAAFREALQSLRRDILGAKSRSALKVNVVVVLSSAGVYTQVFDLPYLEGEALERAVALNIKMASPAPDTYSGWQVASPLADRSRIAVLVAFLDRHLVDGIVESLRETGFSPVVVESKALALARLVRETASQGDPHASRVVVSADAEGLDIFVMRGGDLYFDYAHPWQELQGDAKEISLEAFRAIVVRSLTQVLHYYSAHWKEPISEILVGATGLKDEIIAAVRESSGLAVRELLPLISPPPVAEWFTALGSALRGRSPRKQDTAASLLGIDAQEAFRREEVEHFLGFWRILVPATLAMLLVIIAGGSMLLSRIERSVAAEELFRTGSERSKEIEALKEQAAAFNRSVAFFDAADRSASKKAPLLAKVADIALRHSIAIGRLSLQGGENPVVLSGTAALEADIREFKKELESTAGIREVNLPFTEIRKSGDTYTFSISFLASSS